jgi:branched-chain amino acid transport system substrate-binding protein
VIGFPDDKAIKSGTMDQGLRDIRPARLGGRGSLLQREKQMKRLWLTSIALGASAFLAGSVAAQDIPVGIAGPMTGQYAAFGTQFKNGAELAVADINAAGGVLGKKLKLEVGDDACDPKQARAVAEKLASMKLPVVIGHFCSSSSIPASEPYAESNVLQISPASTNPQFTERGLWNTFRVCGRDDQQGAVAGQYLATAYKGKNIAILHDRSTYGKGLADETRAELKKRGGKDAMYESYAQGDRDFTALVSRMKAANIDVVYLGGYHTEGGLILRQMRDQGMKTMLVGGDALVTNEFWAITGTAGEGVRMTFGPDPRNKPTAKAAVAKFKAKGIDPEGYTLYSYAAFQVWSQAAAKAGSTDPKKVAGVMKGGKWSTVLGDLSFDKKGDITVLDYVWYEWKKDGSYAEIGGKTN